MRQLTRLAGWTRPVEAKSAMFIITRGAKPIKPAPRSGSRVMVAPMRKLRSPKPSIWPT